MKIIKDLGYFKKEKHHAQAAHYVLAACEKCGKEKIRSLQQARLSKGCRKCFSGKSNIVHNDSKTKLYHRYYAIKKRCYSKDSKDYKYYGGRGIKMSDEWKNDWLSFKKWAYDNGYYEGTNLTIDRIDNNGNYCAENCRFVDRVKQAHNQRVRKTSKVGLIGVNKNKLNSKWYSTCMHNGKRIQFGGFLTSKEAVDARNEYIKKHHLNLRMN